MEGEDEGGLEMIAEGVLLEGADDVDKDSLAAILELSVAPGDRSRLVKIYVLRITSPSRPALEGDDEVAVDVAGVGEAVDVEGLIGRVEEMLIEDFAPVRSCGVRVSVSEEAVERVESINEWLAGELRRLGLPPHSCKISVVPVYLRVSDTKEMLMEAKEAIEEEIEELRREMLEGGGRSALMDRIEGRVRLLGKINDFIKRAFLTRW